MMDFRETYFEIWKSAWDFHKRFVNIQGTDEEWEAVVNTSGEIVENYKNKPGCEFLKDLLLATLSELERQDKIKRKEHEKIG